MKMPRILEYLRHEQGELIASWGDAELIRRSDGRYELRGGTPDDRQAARAGQLPGHARPESSAVAGVAGAIRVVAAHR